MEFIRYPKRYASIFIYFFIIGALFLSLPSLAMAETQSDQGAWYRLRTNHVPFRPAEINPDTQGQLWMSAVEEYDPAVWRLDPETGKVDYISNNQKNNYLGAGFINFIHKPHLSAEVVYVLPDSRGNTWYALKDKGVCCEKADGQWLSFTQENTGQQLPSNDFQRIRLLKKSDGSEQVLLISNDGLALIDASYQLAGVRPRESSYHNYMFNDALIDSQGRYWVGRNNGLEMGDHLLNTANVNILFADQQSLPPVETPVTGMLEDRRGNFWFISHAYGSQGVYCFQADGKWVHYDLQRVFSIPNQVINQVICLAEDKSGCIWFGLYYGGLLRYTPGESGGNWTAYTGSSLGLQSEEIISIVSTNKGICFVTGYNPSVPGNGTGVYCLPLNDQGQPQTEQLLSYDYRSRSTSLASNRIAGVAADRQGGVWFASYDRPSLARLKADGSWQQFHSGQDHVQLGEFGIVGVVADAQDHIFIAPQRQQPLAYNAAQEEWVNLPTFPGSDVFFYGVYRDREDSIWFYSAEGVYYLNPDHSAWRHFTQGNSGLQSDYVDYGVLVDTQRRVWLQGRYGVSLLERTENGEQWQSFTNGDNSGYSSGYRVYEDDQGQIWNAAKQRYNPQNGQWENPSDSSAFDGRTLHFLNGDLAANMDLSPALAPVTILQEELVTVDTRGRVYFAAGMSSGLASVNAGVVVYDPGLQLPVEERYERWTGTTGTVGVPLDKEWRIRFNQPVDPTCLSSNFRIKTTEGQDFAVVPEIWSGDASGATVVIKHPTPFAPDTGYTLFISKNVKQRAGAKRLAHGWRLDFTTASARGPRVYDLKHQGWVRNYFSDPPLKK